MPTGGTAFDKSLNVLLRNTTFYEDCLDLVIDHEGYQVIHLLDAGFALGADALDAADFEIVGSTKVMESVMSGDQHPPGFIDGSQLSKGISMEPVEFTIISCCSFLVIVGMAGVVLAEFIQDTVGSLLPDGDIEPEMRIDDAFFGAIHQDRKPLTDEASITNWVAGQGIDRTLFQNAYRSFSVQLQMKRADDLSCRVRLPSVPALLIDGKYLLPISDNGNFADQLEFAKTLIERARRERTAVKKAAP